FILLSKVPLNNSALEPKANTRVAVCPIVANLIFSSSLPRKVTPPACNLSLNSLLFLSLHYR
ncbi:MAG: hypothetical protein ACK5LR_06975, partial [Mangrovibacterium sp.]